MKKINKNYTLWAMFFVLVLASCGGNAKKPDGESRQAATGETDLKRDKLQGKVKSVRQRVYWALEKFGRMEKGKLQNLRGQDYLRLYNEDGFLTAETYFDARDTVVSLRKFSYTDKPGQLAREEAFTGSNLSSTTVYTYANDRLTKKEILDGAGKVKEGYGYSYYDDSGLLMDEDRLNSAGKLVQKIVHVYDKLGVLIEKQYYWGGGSPYKKEQLEYADGKLVKITKIKYENREEVPDGYIEYEGYSDGEFTDKKVFDATGKQIETVQHRIDQFGNLIANLDFKLVQSEPEEEYESQDVADSTTETTDGTEVDSENTDGDESDATDSDSVDAEWSPPTGYFYQYEYDAKNNWTRKITYKAAPNENHETAFADRKDVESVRQFYYDRVIEYY